MLRNIGVCILVSIAFVMLVIVGVACNVCNYFSPVVENELSDKGKMY